MYIFGTTTYRTKAEVAAAVQTLLRTPPCPRRLDGDNAALVWDLLAQHPSATAKYGVGAVAVWVRANRFGNPSLFVERRDGTFEDFSYQKCLTPPTHSARVTAAFRHAIVEQILAAKAVAWHHADSLGRVPCEVTGELIDVNRAHVDHAYPATFDAMLRAFLYEHRLTLEAVDVQAHPSGQGVELKDPWLRRTWQQYHQAHAVLRIVDAAVNVQRGNRG